MSRRTQRSQVDKSVFGLVGVLCAAARTRLAGDAYLLLHAIAHNDNVMLVPVEADPIEITTARGAKCMAETRQVLITAVLYCC